MVHKPLLTLLQHRLAPCQLQGTSITESGITVSTDKLSDETIFFFRIDNDAGRVLLDMVGLRVCDCLVFYTKDTKQEELLCLLELKAAGLGEATEQIISVHCKLKSFLDNVHTQYATLIACVCMRHQVPPGDMRHAEKLKRLFGKNNVYLKFGIKKHFKEFGMYFRQRGA